MVLRRWIVRGGQFKRDTEICELETDGRLSVFRASGLHPDDTAGVYYHYVDEGQEIGPSGGLLEFSDVSSGSDFRLHESACDRRYGGENIRDSS